MIIYILHNYPVYFSFLGFKPRNQCQISMSEINYITNKSLSTITTTTNKEYILFHIQELWNSLVFLSYDSYNHVCQNSYTIITSIRWSNQYCTKNEKNILANVVC